MVPPLVRKAESRMALRDTCPVWLEYVFDIIGLHRACIPSLWAGGCAGLCPGALGGSGGGIGNFDVR